MFLECKLNEKLVLLVDAESVGGVDKSQINANTDPDAFLDNSIEIIQAIADRLGKGLSIAGAPAPVSMEVDFGIYTNSNALVCLARNPQDAQFRVKMRWDA